MRSRTFFAIEVRKTSCSSGESGPTSASLT